MSRPRKRKPRSGEQDASGEQDGLTEAEGAEGIETLSTDADSEPAEPLFSSDEDVVRAVDEVADAIVARVLAGELAVDDDGEPDGEGESDPEGEGEPDPDAAIDAPVESALEVQTLDLDALEAAGIGAKSIDLGGPDVDDDGDGSMPGEDTEDRPGLEKAPPLAVSDEHLKGVIESLVFVSDKPLAANRLAKIANTTTKDAQRLLDVLAEDYRGRGVELVEVAGGYQFRSAAANAPFVRELVARKPVRLTRAQIEALAMIAYRQPITRPEVDEIRGVDSGSAMKVLLEKNLVKIIGRKDEAGRPLLYGTTPFFLEFFGLASLSDLPTLREYSDLNDESRALFQRRTGEAIEDIADIQVEKHDYSDEDLEAAAKQVTTEAALDEEDTQMSLPSPGPDDDDDDAPTKRDDDTDDDDAPATPGDAPDDDDDDSDDDDSDDDDDDESDDEDEDDDDEDEDDDDEDEDDD